jgi:hypothetical protein
MMKVINKVLQSVNSEPNRVEIAGSLPLQVFRKHMPTSEATILLMGDNKSGSNACTAFPEICICLGAGFRPNKIAIALK